MGYQAKWVEQHLGITRKGLRVYEKKGLIPPNLDSNYRDYSEEEIEWLWTIKLLQGMGFTLSEIAKMREAGDKDFDFSVALSEKVHNLQEQKESIEHYIGYGKMILLTGRFPERPHDFENVSGSEFRENARNTWNTLADEKSTAADALVTQVLGKPTAEWHEEDLYALLQNLLAFGINQEELEKTALLDRLLKSIVARSNLGATSSEVQMLVTLLFEEFQKENNTMTPRQFGRLYSSSFMEGQIGQMNQQKYGLDACSFLADAIAIFGGYKNYKDSI